MIINLLNSIKNEFLSYFVTERIEYKISGECKKCGKCCRYMYSVDEYSPTDFKIMQFLFPAYRRFYIRGRDEAGRLVFACKYVGDDGLCTVYKKRLKMCRNYPMKSIRFNGELHEGCGYKIERPKFEDYLK